MSSEETERTICAGCGAKLTPDLRYCLYCYRPLSAKSSSRLHLAPAGAADPAPRSDPTLVFLPEERAARLQRARRRKRLLIGAAITLAVAGIVSAALLILNHESPRDRQRATREKLARRELSLLADGLDRFKTDMGRYPTNDEGLNGLTNKPAAAKPGDRDRLAYWFGPYVDGDYEVDPWGNDYVYEATPDALSFVLFSYGGEGDSGASIRLRVASPAL